MNTGKKPGFVEEAGFLKSLSSLKTAIYFGQVGSTLVLLLCGGDKSTQDRDIRTAL